MSLATSSDNKPWVCEVHFAYDDNLNLYFRSRASTRHCEDIIVNNRVAGNIVTQHKLGDKVRGVYFEGKAELLENVGEQDEAFMMYNKRFGATKDILEEAKLENGHQFYKIVVEDFYLFDSRESSPSQKYHLSWQANI
jgi:uncharacterized protein YhbP (UPF0306 family)